MDTPNTSNRIDEALEQARVSDRLDRVETRLESLERVAVASDNKLARLVELHELADRRQSEEARFRRAQEVAREAAQRKREEDERKQAAARGAWLRSLVSRELVLRVFSALVGLAGGLGAGFARSALTAAPPPPTPAVHVAAPVDP